MTAKSVLEAGQALGVPYNVGARILRQVLSRLPVALEKLPRWRSVTGPHLKQPADSRGSRPRWFA